MPMRAWRTTTKMMKRRIDGGGAEERALVEIRLHSRLGRLTLSGLCEEIYTVVVKRKDHVPALI